MEWSRDSIYHPTTFIYQHWYRVEVGTFQYFVTEISLFLCLSLSLFNPLFVSMTLFLPSIERHLIQHVPEIQNRDEILGVNGPGRRRVWYSYAWKV